MSSIDFNNAPLENCGSISAGAIDAGNSTIETTGDVNCANITATGSMTNASVDAGAGVIQTTGNASFNNISCNNVNGSAVTVTGNATSNAVVATNDVSAASFNSSLFEQVHAVGLYGANGTSSTYTFDTDGFFFAYFAGDMLILTSASAGASRRTTLAHFHDHSVESGNGGTGALTWNNTTITATKQGGGGVFTITRLK